MGQQKKVGVVAVRNFEPIPPFGDFRGMLVGFTCKTKFIETRGVARIFLRGGVTLCQSKNIVMAFSPPVVGCLLKKAYKRGGHGHPRTPPGYALD